jgi:hypothetical protein
MFRMHRLWGLAAVLLCSGCLKEKVQYCNNGALCPEPLVCTENAVEPFCGDRDTVTQCLGKPDETACVFPDEPNGYCLESVCTKCDPNLAFCRYETWTAMNPIIGGMRVATDLNSVWADATTLVAVGRTGTVIRWDGRLWSALPAIVADADYETMWGFDANTIYAATTGTYSGTKVFRFDGSTWVPQLPSPASFVSALWGPSPNLVFAVGQAGEVGQYTGTWTYAMQSASTLNGVFGVDANNAIAVGNAGTAIRYTGTWAPEPTGTTYLLKDVGGAGGVELAVGRVSAANSAGVAIRKQGAWTDLSSSLPAGTLDLKGVWVVSPTLAYAVGDSGILSFDGTTWTNVVPGMVFNEIVGSPTDLYAVGASGTVMRLSR